MYEKRDERYKELKRVMNNTDLRIVGIEKGVRCGFTYTTLTKLIKEGKRVLFLEPTCELAQEELPRMLDDVGIHRSKHINYPGKRWNCFKGEPLLYSNKYPMGLSCSECDNVDTCGMVNAEEMILNWDNNDIRCITMTIKKMEVIYTTKRFNERKEHIWKSLIDFADVVIFDESHMLVKSESSTMNSSDLKNKRTDYFVPNKLMKLLEMYSFHDPQGIGDDKYEDGNILDKEAFKLYRAFKRIREGIEYMKNVVKFVGIPKLDMINNNDYIGVYNGNWISLDGMPKHQFVIYDNVMNCKNISDFTCNKKKRDNCDISNSCSSCPFLKSTNKVMHDFIIKIGDNESNKWNTITDNFYSLNMYETYYNLLQFRKKSVDYWNDDIHYPNALNYSDLFHSKDWRYNYIKKEGEVVFSACEHYQLQSRGDMIRELSINNDVILASASQPPRDMLETMLRVENQVEWFNWNDPIGICKSQLIICDERSSVDTIYYPDSDFKHPDQKERKMKHEEEYMDIYKSDKNGDIITFHVNTDKKNRFEKYFVSGKRTKSKSYKDYYYRHPDTVGKAHPERTGVIFGLPYPPFEAFYDFAYEIEHKSYPDHSKYHEMVDDTIKIIDDKIFKTFNNTGTVGVIASRELDDLLKDKRKPEGLGKYARIFYKNNKNYFDMLKLLKDKGIRDELYKFDGGRINYKNLSDEAKNLFSKVMVRETDYMKLGNLLRECDTFQHFVQSTGRVLDPAGRENSVVYAFATKRDEVIRLYDLMSYPHILRPNIVSPLIEGHFGEDATLIARIFKLGLHEKFDIDIKDIPWYARLYNGKYKDKKSPSRIFKNKWIKPFQRWKDINDDYLYKLRDLRGVLK